MTDLINMNGTDDPFYRYLVKRIKVKHETGKTVIINNDIISKQTGRPNEWIVTYIGQVLGVSTNIDKKNQNKCVLTGKHEEHIIQEKYFEFVKKYILCKYCGNPETMPKIVGKKKNTCIELSCRSCGKTYELDSSDKFVKFMLLHPINENDDKKIKTTDLEERTEENKVIITDDDLGLKIGNKTENKEENNSEDNDSIDLDEI
jgi:translation initiation factor 2 beta subunit (eIF-2beta)/eIF-5